MTQNFFERKIKGILQYIGAIGASLMAIVYVVVVIVMIQGFSRSIDMKNTIVFAVVNALIGLLIMQFLKVQGISFAQNDPKNKEILEQYYKTKTKDKKPRSIRFFWVTSAAKDTLIKGASVAASSIGVIYLVIQGSHDYHLLLLAAANLIMFVCFGLLALNSAYEFYNNRHIPYIIEQIKEGTRNDSTS